ncbi:MAG: aminotransferase class I/II-fold pyridoxal phosphate-dependent enzyme, partial [Comamonadaceae bacterium]
YGERCGGLSVVCKDKAEADRVLGQLKSAVRANYSSPPTHGARLVTQVLDTPELRAEWEAELGEMRARIKDMRERLYAALNERFGGQRDFGYFLTQRGMFSYTGLTPEQVDRLRDEHGVYLVRSGRMCIAGLSTKNVDHVAQAVAAVLA